MSPTDIRINDLRVRASGLTAEQARRLGKLVASHLAEKPVSLTQSRTIGNLKVELQCSITSVEQMAMQIAHGVRNKLK